MNNDVIFNEACRIVCTHSGIDKNELVKKSRKRDIVQARQIIFYLVRKVGAKYAYVESQSRLGMRLDKDHATVLYAVTNISNLMESDNTFFHQVNMMSNDFKKILIELKRVEKEKPKIYIIRQFYSSIKDFSKYLSFIHETFINQHLSEYAYQKILGLFYEKNMREKKKLIRTFYK